MKPRTFHIDFETRSSVDLGKCGVYVYAASQNTDILCLAAVNEDAELELFWKLGDPKPEWLFQEIKAGSKFIAHNASFEWAIWNGVAVRKYGWEPLPIEQLYCTMAQCYAMALPGSLKNAALALGLDAKKDESGHRVMMQLSQPRDWDENGAPIWWEEKSAKDAKDLEVIKTKFQKLYDYCVQDVYVEHELFKKLFPLSPAEREIWLLDQKINARGVRLDVKAAEGAIALYEFEKAHINAELRRITENRVATVASVAQFKEWLGEWGVPNASLAKAEVSDLLDDDILPPVCREALELRRASAKSSVAKLEAMLRGVSRDGRVRGCFQYHGANTGRWAGRRLQFQNLVRSILPFETVAAIIEKLRRIVKT